MRNRSALFIAIIVAALGCFGAYLALHGTTAATSPAAGTKTAASRPEVAATIFPLADIVRNVAGTDVRVALLLPPGASPHTFEPDPSTVRDVVSSKAIYAVGHGADDWVNAVAKNNGTPIVTVDEGIALKGFPQAKMFGDSPSPADVAEHAGTDPHYWLDVTNAEQIARNVAADLSARFPDHAADFSANLASYERKLAAADSQVRDILSNAQKPMVTLHDAWYYFGRAYGLDIIGTFEPAPGKAPTPKYLATLAKAVQDNAITTIYTEPEISTSTLAPFIQDHHLTVATLDPIGGTKENASYIELVRNNARTIADHQH